MLPVTFIAHALKTLGERGLTENIVLDVVMMPEQILEQENGRFAYQKRIIFGDRTYLIRAIVERLPEALLVVTAYRTSKIEKYWRSS